MAAADRDGDGEVDAKEFLALMKSMRIGNPHEGPVALQASSYEALFCVQNIFHANSKQCVP